MLTLDINKQFSIKQLSRFVINGIFATLVHYVIFVISIEFFYIKFIALANLIGAFFGISCSFIGNKYFVFKNNDFNLKSQLLKFTLTYAFLGFVSSTILFVWSDLFKMNYNYGFIFAAFFQFILSFIINRNWVFR